MKRDYLILLLCLLICSCVSGNKPRINSTLSIDIELAEADSTDGINPFACIMNVEQRIVVSNQQDDSISLNLVFPKSLPVNELGVRKVRVLCGDSELPSSFENDVLTFKTHSGQNEYILSYEVNASCFMSNGFGPNNCVVGDFYIYDHSSWYFTCPNMELSDASIKASDSLFVISSGIHSDNTELDKHYKPRHRLDVAALHKRFYKQINFESNNCKCNLFLRNFPEDAIELDTIFDKNKKYNADYFDSRVSYSQEHIESKVDHVKQCIQLASSLFDSAPNTMNIIECLWGNETYGGGQAISPKLVVVDTVFLSKNDWSMLHEIIHTCDNVDYHLICQDSSLFFFSESMIEYLTRYLITSEIDNDYHPSWDINDDNTENDESQSIFNIEHNNSESQYIIYAYTPYAIEKFAKKIGEQKFVELYKDFHKECWEKQELSFDQFIRFYRKKGIPQNDLDDFITSLSIGY